jgi:bacterioferritin-associated ferredoxin
VKKTTKVAILSTLVFSLMTIPSITAQAVTLPFLSSIFDTIQSYVSIANTILAGARPSTAELATSVNAVSDSSIYGVTGVDTSSAAFAPVDADGEINFDETADDPLSVKLAEDEPIKTRSIGEFQSVANLAAYQSATRVVGAAAKRAETSNKELVSAAQNAISKAQDIRSSQPIGTCDSSLCAENTSNILIAQQINLQSAAISLAIMGNTYSKINNNQQAIMLKNDQDKKAEEVVKARLSNTTSGTKLRNRFNANLLIRTAY